MQRTLQVVFISVSVLLSASTASARLDVLCTLHYIYDSITKKPFDEKALIKFTSDSYLSPLTKPEIELLKRIHKLTSGNKYVETLLKNYRGPQNARIERLKLQAEWIEDVYSGQDLSRWVNSLTVPVQFMWENLKTKGYELKLRRTPITDMDGTLKQFQEDESKKIAWIYLDDATESPELALAGALLKQNALLKVQEGMPNILFRAEELVAQSKDNKLKILGLTQKADEMSIGDSELAIASMSGMFKKDAVNVLSFLVEREVMQGKQRLYSEARELDPSTKSQFWENFEYSSDPEGEIGAYLAGKYLTGSPDVLYRVESTSLIDMVMYSRVRAGLSPREPVTKKPPFPWKSVKEIAASTPKILRKRSADRFHSATESTIKQGEVISEAQALELVKYAENPAFSMRPYETGMQLEKKFNLSIFDKKGVQNGVDVHDNVQLSLRILTTYDKKHGTNYAAETGVKILNHLQRSSETGDNRSIHYFIASAAEDSTHPRAIHDYMNALLKSPSKSGFLSDPNNVYMVERMLLKIRKNPELVKPAPELVDLFIQEMIHFLPDYWQAQTLLTTGEHYFRKTGDPVREKKYREDSIKFRERIRSEN